jgi:hypothetical protein
MWHFLCQELNTILHTFDFTTFKSFRTPKVGLPDGISAYQKSQFWYISEDLKIENVVRIFLLLFGIFYGHVVYFVVIWYILWPCGIFCSHLVYFMAMWYIL